MKLYTRTGDDGSTGLFGGGRVPKNHPRVEAYGTVDELNASFGLVLACLNSTDLGHLKQGQSEGRHEPTEAMARVQGSEVFTPIFITLQSRLFDLGADLATPESSKHESKISRINAEHVKQAEDWIDHVESGNTPMTHFVLPGGTELSARLHLARTICRRAERVMIALSQSEEVNPQAIIFINRISDLLFAMARRANKEAGVKDVEWVPGSK